MKTHFALIFALCSAAAFAAPQPGDTAPDFSLNDLHGQKHALSEYKGKYVVLEWNNPGCPFVRKHYESGNMPRLEQEERAKWRRLAYHQFRLRRPPGGAAGQSNREIPFR